MEMSHAASHKSDGLDDKEVLPAITIGDPALLTGGNAALFYGGIIAAIIVSVFAWWYVNRGGKAKNRIGSPPTR